MTSSLGVLCLTSFNIQAHVLTFSLSSISYNGSLFANGKFDAEDDEADAVYQQVDDRMDERRRIHRQKRQKEELEKFRKERPKIQQMFADVTVCQPSFV